MDDPGLAYSYVSASPRPASTCCGSASRSTSTSTATSSARIGAYDAIIVRSATRVTGELIDRAPRLKVIGRAGVGVDNVDLAAATKRGIVVVNAPQSTVVSAAEHTIGLLLALVRSIPQAYAALKDGRWERSRFGGVELADKTLGLVGLGRIGQQVARRARGLSMHVVAFDPFMPPERMRELGVEPVASLDDLLRRSDVVSLHATLTPETRRMIGKEEIARMRHGVRIVNVARGELIDEEALVEGLRSGKVAGAAIDVFEQEPYTGELLGIENVVVTPHLGASTREAQDRAGVIVAEQVAATLEGRVASNAVNVPAVPPEELEFLGPFLPLAAMLGELAFELAGGNPSRLELEYLGELARRDTRLLTVAALNGAFRGRVEEAVNYVNAPVVARERGLEVREESSSATRDFTSLMQVTAVAAAREVTVAGTTIGARASAQARQRARLRDRGGSRAEHDLHRQRGSARPDRTGRVDARPGGGQHRDDGGQPEPTGRQGADDADGRHAVDCGARRSPARRAGLRRGHDHHARDLMPTSQRGPLPEPVQRVARFLADTRAEARLQEFRSGTPTAVDAADAVGCELDQIVKSLLFLCDGDPVLVLVPGSRRADPGKVAAAVGAASAKIAPPPVVLEITGFEAGGVAPFPQPGVREVLVDPSLLSWPEVWVGAGSDRHMAGLTPVELVRLSRARQADVCRET